MPAIHRRLASTARSDSSEPPFFKAISLRCSIRRERYVSGSRVGVRDVAGEVSTRASSGVGDCPGNSVPVDGRDAGNWSRGRLGNVGVDGVDLARGLGSNSGSVPARLPALVNFSVRRFPVATADGDDGELPVSATSAGIGLGSLRRRIRSSGAPTGLGIANSGSSSSGRLSTAPASIKGAVRSAAPRWGSTRVETSIDEFSRFTC